MQMNAERNLMYVETASYNGMCTEMHRKCDFTKIKKESGFPINPNKNCMAAKKNRVEISEIHTLQYSSVCSVRMKKQFMIWTDPFLPLQTETDDNEVILQKIE